jgi:hypothetical protein
VIEGIAKAKAAAGVGAFNFANRRLGVVQLIPRLGTHSASRPCAGTPLGEGPSR